MIYTIIIYTCITLICNALYYFACEDSYPDCGTLSIVFVNLALLSQFLSLIIKNDMVENNQKNGQRFICSVYLIFEIIVAGFCVYNNVSIVKAGILQILMFGVFIITFFGIARAYVKTNRAIADSRSSKSGSLVDTNNTLRCAIARCQSIEDQNILQEILAEINSMPITSNEMLEQIDSEILIKTTELCKNPKSLIKGELSRLLNRRKTMLMVINQ